MKTKQKFWRALEALADGATLADWKLELGDEFERAQPFLFETQNESRSYPCPKASPCECRQHRIERFEKERRIAVCECGECPPLDLTANDLLIYELNKPQLAKAVAQACGWTVAADGWELPVWRLGRWDDLRGNLFWCESSGRERTRKIADSLLASEQSPFILLMPTAVNLSGRLDGALKREGCLALPLDEYLTVENDGKFRLVKSLETARQEFLERSAKRDTAKVLRGLEEKFDAVGHWKPDLVPAIPPPPKFLVRLESSRPRAGKQDRTKVSTWRVWFNGDDTLLPPWAGAEYLIFLISRQGKEFDASTFTTAVRKNNAAVAVAGADVNTILYGGEAAVSDADNQRGRIGELTEPDVIWDKNQIAAAMETIKRLLEEKKAHEKANDFSSAAYADVKKELEEQQDLVRHNTKMVNGKLVPKEYQKGTTKEKAELIGKHFRKLLNEHLRAACRPLFDHLKDKNTLYYGIKNCYRPKPAIRWEFDFKGGNKGT